MSDTPRVTIGIVAYNNGQYLPAALDAVLAQDFTDFEVVICDNQSTDETWEICQRYAERDSRFRIYRNETNLGQSGNFARVVSLARGEYFRLTAHDDLIAPTLLRRCVEVLDANPRAVLAYPRSIIIDGDGQPFGEHEDDLDLRDANPTKRLAQLVSGWVLCNEIFGVIRLAELRKTRLFGPFPSNDYGLAAELIVRGEFQLIDEPLFYRRIHADSVLGSNRTGEGSTQAWLEPNHTASKRYDKLNGDHYALVAHVTRALLTAADLAPLDRVRFAATFLAVAETKRARVFLGALRRRLMKEPMYLEPWEARS